MNSVRIETPFKVKLKFMLELKRQVDLCKISLISTLFLTFSKSLTMAFTHMVIDRSIVLLVSVVE